MNYWFTSTSISKEKYKACEEGKTYFSKCHQHCHILTNYPTSQEEILFTLRAQRTVGQPLYHYMAQPCNHSSKASCKRGLPNCLMHVQHLVPEFLFNQKGVSSKTL